MLLTIGVGLDKPLFRKERMAVNTQDLERFEAFIKQARRQRRSRLKNVPTKRFETFTRRSQRILAEPSAERRKKLSDAIQLLGWWFTEHDLLSAIGYPCLCAHSPAVISPLRARS